MLTLTGLHHRSQEPLNKELTTKDRRLNQHSSKANESASREIDNTLVIGTDHTPNKPLLGVKNNGDKTSQQYQDF